MRRQTLLVMGILFGFLASLFIGCEEGSDAQGTALLGAAVGAGIGALAGDGDAVATGAIAGAGAGYMIGNESDKSKQRKEINQIRQEQNTVTIWITNSNGSQIPVRLVKDGPGYIGPRGERYPTMPSEAQLKQVYGF